MEIAAHIRVEVDEPTLDGVKPEDKALVRDVIAVLQAIQSPNQICKGWSVNNVTGGYDVLGHIDPALKDCELFLHDLDILKQLDFARITDVAVRIASPQFVQLRVRVVGRDVPVCITQCDVIRIQKKRKWYQFDR